MRKKFSFRSRCPISSALDLVGDRWSLLIVRDIAFAGKRTFSDFAGSDEGIATSILADRLKRLERAGIVRKEKLPDNRKTNIYTLTEKGADLAPIIVEYILWSDRYLPEHITDEARVFASKLRTNRTAILNDRMAAGREAMPGRS